MLAGMRAVRSWTEYFETFDRTLAMTAKLEAFCDGRETAESLAVWARTLWHSDGTQEGPFRTNSTATAVISDLYSADEREDAANPASGPMLRKVDALDSLRELRQGTAWVRSRPVASIAGRFSDWAVRLRAEPIRTVLDGLGWFEFVRFASPGTGRAFLMSNALSRHGGEEPYQPALNAQAEGDAFECLVDLVETLCIDASDLTWMAEEFTDIRLPEWAVCRQDDNGVGAEVAVFSGRHKARAAMERLEAGKHKQTYWVAERKPPA